MRSPSKMTIIEIDITNACDKRCSNCTRLCGHHQKPFFMDFETFKQAVDSLDGFEGVRSMMGGEPTLHPDFERFITYLGSKFTHNNDTNTLIRPQKNFIQAIQRRSFDNYKLLDNGEKLWINGAGMFSNMGKGYRKYYELCSDYLSFQGLNDHLNPIYHQSALITRKELGISDEEWVSVRDRCWMQNEWSASITPKGCFFCEIAGVFDMLLDGPGGWKIEPGWWKREPKDFGDQLHWCEICGFALNTFTRDSSEEIDDVSPEWFERLKVLKSRKLESGRVNIIEIHDGKIAEKSMKENKFFSAAMPYIEHYEDRFNAINSVLFVHDYSIAEIPDGDKFGYELNEILKSDFEWFILHSIDLPDNTAEKLSKYVLNPGTMHCSFYDNGYSALFSKNALSLRLLGHDAIINLKSFRELVSSWQPQKVIPFSFDEFDKEISHFTLQQGVRIAVWGTGSAGSQAADAIKLNNAVLVMAVDIDKTKLGKNFYGVTIEEPNTITKKKNEFDYLIAANYTKFNTIKRSAIELGIEENRILLMNQL
jgi:hypothetical protein